MTVSTCPLPTMSYLMIPSHQCHLGPRRHLQQRLHNLRLHNLPDKRQVMHSQHMARSQLTSREQRPQHQSKPRTQRSDTHKFEGRCHFNLVWGLESESLGLCIGAWGRYGLHTHIYIYIFFFYLHTYIHVELGAKSSFFRVFFLSLWVSGQSSQRVLRDHFFFVRL